MKEANCYVALDFEGECRKAVQSSELCKEFQLPDGNVINMMEERFKSAEILFSPKLINRDLPGIHELVQSSISDTDIDLRRDFYRNIVVSGGGSILPGFKERLSKELTALTFHSIRISVVAPPERKYSVWIGGSIVSSFSVFKSMWIRKEEYEESGSNIVVRRCLLDFCC